MNDSARSVDVTTTLIMGFVSGFLATLIFHQLTLALLWGVGIAPFAPFPMSATQPFGIPAVISLALWGGVWGVLFALAARAFPDGVSFWITAFAFGAILPSAVALLIVLPLKGKLMGGGWHPPLLITALLINGAWGVGTGFILRALSRRFGPSAVGAR